MEKRTKIILGVAAIGVMALILSNLRKKTAPTVPIQVSDSELSKTISTKDCVLDYYDCSKSRYETIQIPMDADCNTYQPAKPQCMKPMDIDLPDFVISN